MYQGAFRSLHIEQYEDVRLVVTLSHLSHTLISRLYGDNVSFILAKIV